MGRIRGSERDDVDEMPTSDMGDGEAIKKFFLIAV